MSIAVLSAADEFRLSIRANYRCEYCRKELQGNNYEVDHIVPVSLGGSDNLENLAFSCARCNRNKGARVIFIDPISRQAHRLFNPRTQRWDVHFKSVGDEVIGKTRIGSATAALLFRVTHRYSPPDLLWDKLEGLDRNESLYRFLNDLRFRRLNNQFTKLAAGLEIEPPEARTTDELNIAELSKLLLRLELFFTRSTHQDIADGIRLGTKNFPRMPTHLRKELGLILSILHQQRAAVRYLQGNFKGAVRDQELADQFFQVDSERGLVADPASQTQLRETLRKQAVKTKYTPANHPAYMLRNLLRSAVDLNDASDFRHFTYLTDVALNSQTPDIRTLEALYAALSEILDDSGYGQTVDQARFVTLRRRWWFLHLMLESEPWIDALISDMGYWKKIRMFNELRELRLGLVAYVLPFNKRSGELALNEIELFFGKREKRQTRM